MAALPINILRAAFDRARTRLSKITGAANDGEKMPAEFAARLEADIANCGPPGWLDWTPISAICLSIAGEDSNIGQFLPRTPQLFGADGQRLLRARRVTHLPCDPGRSDIEVFVDTPWTMVLGERK